MRVPPPFWALAAALAQRVLSRGAPAPTPRRIGAAITVALASTALAGASVIQFRGRGTTVEPFRPDRASVLVRTGANSISRNPMYVGMAGLLAANATRQGSWLSLLPLAGFVVAIDRLQIATEESALRANFGSEYETYRATVPRWLDHRSVVSLWR